MSSFARRLVNTFTRRLSNVFLLFGLALVLVGAGLQASRELRQAAATRRPAPAFGASLRAPGGSPAARAPVATALPSAPPDRILIPAIGLDAPVVEVGWEARVVNGEADGNVWQTASQAVGFHRGAAPPGRVGNTVLSGHNNLDGAVFRDLHAVQPFDWVYLFAGGRRFAYLVEETFIVPEEKASPTQRLDNVKWIGATPDERLTLVTCFPPWSNTHRAIVLARPVADPADLPADAPVAPPAATPLAAAGR